MAMTSGGKPTNTKKYHGSVTTRSLYILKTLKFQRSSIPPTTPDQNTSSYASQDPQNPQGYYVTSPIGTRRHVEHQPSQLSALRGPSDYTRPTRTNNHYHSSGHGSKYKLNPYHFSLTLLLSYLLQQTASVLEILVTLTLDSDSL